MPGGLILFQNHCTPYSADLQYNDCA